MKTYRCLLLAACAGASLIVPFASQATPLVALGPAGTTSPVVPVDYDEHGKGYRNSDRHEGGHRRHQDDDDDQDDDEGGRDARGGRGNVVSPDNATPPANGLFSPGSKPRAQTN